MYVYLFRAQKDAIAKDEQQQKVSHTRRLHHASEVKKQVQDIEQQKINARKAFFEEGIKLDQEAKERLVYYHPMVLLVHALWYVWQYYGIHDNTMVHIYGNTMVYMTTHFFLFRRQKLDAIKQRKLQELRYVKYTSVTFCHHIHLLQRCRHPREILC